jgi:low affinity Fe/Cu permease
MEPALGRRSFLTVICLAAAVVAALSGPAGSRSYSAFVVVTAVAIVLVTLVGQRRPGA